MISDKEQLIDAIRRKKPIRAVYQGYIRFLCVHGIGYKTTVRDGRKVNIVAYQFDGETSRGPVKSGSGHSENWRCMEVSQLSSVELLDGFEWQTSGNHSKSSSCIEYYIAQVED